jgi:ADP-heptose:LPS heptosyltransferase
MFESLRMNIGTRLTAMKFRAASDAVISFASAVSSSKRILVIMPLDRRELLSAFGFIEMLKKHFPEENITVIADDRGLETMRLMPKSHYIHIKEADVNKFYQPRPEFLLRLKDRKFDLAIDLNLDLVLPSAYICRESNASVRVGFKGPNADRFYNFQIQPDPSQSRKNIYDRVARCLEMF